MAYTVGRFWIEALRVDPAHHFLGLRINDWVSIIVFLGALLYFTRVRGPQTRLVAEEDGRLRPVPVDAPDEAASADAESVEAEAADEEAVDARAEGDETEADSGGTDPPGPPAEPEADAGEEADVGEHEDGTAEKHSTAEK
jgi:hypothetical protein